MPLPLVLLYPIASTLLTVGTGAAYAGWRSWSQKKLRAELVGDQIAAAQPEPAADHAVVRADPEAVAIDHALAERDLYTGVSFAGFLMAIGAFWFPALKLPAVLLTLGSSWPLIRDVAGALRRGVVDLQTLIVTVLVTACAVGQPLLAAFLVFANYATGTLLTRTEDDVRADLAGMFGRQRKRAWIRADGVELEVPVEQLRAGDIVVVRAGEVIPVDGVVESGNALVDQRALLGEEVPAAKATLDAVFAGTTLTAGALDIRVERTGNETVASQVGVLLSQTSDYRTRTQRRAEEEVRLFSPIVLAGSALSVPFLGLTGGLALLLCFPGVNYYLTSPFAVLSALHSAARKRVFIKDGRALEVLPKVDLVLFDKTGTLTSDRAEVAAVVTAPAFTEGVLLALAARAEGRQTHPIAVAIRERAGLEPEALDDLAGSYTLGMGVAALVDGRRVSVGSRRHMDNLALAVPPELAALAADWHGRGSSVVYVAVDDAVAGILEVRHVIRDGARRCIETLTARGIACEIVSGDSEHATRHLAERLGIATWHAEQLPHHKSAYVEARRAEGRTVCFIGDGINDAVALKAADISISLRGASTAATDTAAVILLNPDLDHVRDVFAIADRFEASGRLARGFSYLIPIGGVFTTLFLGTGPLFALFLQDIAFWGAFGSVTLGPHLGDKPHKPHKPHKPDRPDRPDRPQRPVLPAPAHS